jgi:hypothetical protein
VVSVAAAGDSGSSLELMAIPVRPWKELSRFWLRSPISSNENLAGVLSGLRPSGIAWPNLSTTNGDAGSGISRC